MSDPIVVTQLVDVPPNEVWPYLSDGGLWARWQGQSCVIEPIVGGRFEMRMPDGAIASGEVLLVTEPERIVFSWGWVGTPLPPGSSTVEIALTPTPEGGTLITLTHSDLPDELVEHHTGGWQRCLTRLATMVRADSG